jgi:uncharacterized protein YcaQ
MLTNREVLRLKVAKKNYYALPESLELLSRPLARNKLMILSPFDNLLIQRKRMQALFNFNYQLECYLPEAKRRYGYFSLPVLWEGQLVARMNCKIEREEARLHIHHLALDPGVKKREAFALALRQELTAFLGFNECSHIRLHRVSPSHFQPLLRAQIDGWGENQRSNC